MTCLDGCLIVGTHAQTPDQYVFPKRTALVTYRSLWKRMGSGDSFTFGSLYNCYGNRLFLSQYGYFILIESSFVPSRLTSPGQAWKIDPLATNHLFGRPSSKKFHKSIALTLLRSRFKGRLSKIQISCSILSNFSSAPDGIAIVIQEGAFSWVGPNQVSPARMIVNAGRCYQESIISLYSPLFVKG